MYPSWMAAHSWYPMSYDPQTRLVYFPAQSRPTSTPACLTTSSSGFRSAPTPAATSATSPELRKTLQAQADAMEKGYLLAWNPATQTEAFRVPYPYPGNGGVLTTAGNLLVEGTIEKNVAVYPRRQRQAPVEDAGRQRGPGRADHLFGGRRAVHRGQRRLDRFAGQRLSKIQGGFRTSQSRPSGV